MDDAAIWFIAFGAPNAGMVAVSLTSLVFLINLILNFKTLAYWFLFILYVGASTYTFWYQITKGVEVIQTIQPEWKGTPSGNLWPFILVALGLIDENDNPVYFGFYDYYDEDDV